MTAVPVIDLFAGPGGLGEGFCAYRCEDGSHPFHIRLSVEKEERAHRTLELRSFYRQFPDGQAPEDYYDYLRLEIRTDEDRHKLFRKHLQQAAAAKRQAMRAELGTADDKRIDFRISRAIGYPTHEPWVLIGGPPCQAYSQVGRSRMKRLREDDPEKYESDERHHLYREYLRIIAKFKPCVFVMENVTGILSSTIKGESVIDRILQDLRSPTHAMTESLDERQGHPSSNEYEIFPLVVRKDPSARLQPSDFVIRCEDYGIPQARHRVIILGVRSDVMTKPGTLKPRESLVAIEDVISDLPKLRSTLSREPDSAQAWKNAVDSIAAQAWVDSLKSSELRDRVRETACQLASSADSGVEFKRCSVGAPYRQDWYADPKLGGVVNHTSRSHMKEDLHRYLYAACFAEIYRRSPRMKDYPKELLPDHKNIDDAVAGDVFPDRFRVQFKGNPATTVTCHISKDGHYFIHYDPAQCRSLTVREAARIQTFPDNYLFEGGRTPQYRQVGNAVPPLLAMQIADIVYEVTHSETRRRTDDGYSVEAEEKLEHVPDPVEEYEAGNGRALSVASDGIPVPAARREASR